ncbi:hypothetical protein QN416_05865 [Glaciimonas sp. Cout2]|uniref:hypothetical protein n=1 Tax=Glaciimonas sp. Cout2 TaxID=3048621 RepID=UPI002B23C838|nr:hypothetical protein [Glaciimonas sp. Cout2]MEB0011149.1 hypothetical protein [Glaciimonas sp. Cout2]
MKIPYKYVDVANFSWFELRGSAVVHYFLGYKFLCKKSFKLCRIMFGLPDFMFCIFLAYAYCNIEKNGYVFNFLNLFVVHPFLIVAALLISVRFFLKPALMRTYCMAWLAIQALSEIKVARKCIAQKMNFFGLRMDR